MDVSESEKDEPMTSNEDCPSRRILFLHAEKKGLELLVKNIIGSLMSIPVFSRNY